MKWERERGMELGKVCKLGFKLRMPEAQQCYMAVRCPRGYRHQLEKLENRLKCWF